MMPARRRNSKPAGPGKREFIRYLPLLRAHLPAEWTTSYALAARLGISRETQPAEWFAFAAACDWLSGSGDGRGILESKPSPVGWLYREARGK